MPKRASALKAGRKEEDYGWEYFRRNDGAKVRTGEENLDALMDVE